MTVAGPSARNAPLRYPSIGLGEAIAKTRTLYEEIYQRRMSREEIAKNLGYTTLNGASIGLISNLTRYGLLEGRQDAVGISADGVVLVVEEPESPDRQAAIRRAALTPEIFKELAEDFGTASVPGENSVRIKLARHGFPRKQAEAASRSFCETMALVVAEGGAYNQSQVTPEAGDQGGTMQSDIPAPPSAPARQVASPTAPASSASSFLAGSDLPPVTFPLPRGNALEIRLRSKISQAEFDRLQPILIGLLQMAVVEEEGD